MFTTSSLTAGTHSITAAYIPSQYFNASTSVAITEVVTAPAVSATASPTTLTIQSGSSGISTLTVASTGGYTGPVSLACGTLPAHISCSFSSSTLTYSGTNNTMSSTLTVGTNASAALLFPRRPGSNGSGLEALVACALLPLFGLFSLRSGRLPRRGLLLKVLLLVASSSVVFGLSGCFGTSLPSSAAWSR